jgi:hypothetical protein
MKALLHVVPVQLGHMLTVAYARCFVSSPRLFYTFGHTRDCCCTLLRKRPQDLARAVHAICAEHSLPAIHVCLESAMQRAAAHASQAAAAACASLLPAEVPAAASSAAAALLAASCNASCAQRLLQEVSKLKH